MIVLILRARASGWGGACGWLLASYPPQRGYGASARGTFGPPLDGHTGRHGLSICCYIWHCVRLCLQEAFLSLLFSLLLDYIPFPKTNTPLSPGEAGVPLWLGFLAHFVFSSLKGSSPHTCHPLSASGLDAALSLKSPSALAATPPGHRRNLAWFSLEG